MATNKKAEFSDEDQRLAGIARALSHPARVNILRILSQHPDFTSTDLVATMPLAQPTISRHLKELQIAGLIFYTSEGKYLKYRIEQSVWDNELGAFESFIKSCLK